MSIYIELIKGISTILYILDALDDSNLDNPFGKNIEHSQLVSVHYKEIGESKVLSIGSNSNSHMDLTAIAIIFVIISILCGIICFIAGSGIGGLWCHRKATKDEKKNVENGIDHPL